MIDHLSTYATDYSATKSFYDEVFGALGYSMQEEMVATWNEAFPTQRMCAYGLDGKLTFWVIEVEEDVSPRHVAFTANSHQEVDLFYKLAIDNGGIDNGEPGFRPAYHENYYAAFVLDPDGNNVEAVCHNPE